MRIFIDADACPVVNETITAAKEANVECIAVCDFAHMIESDTAKVITVSKGADSADFAIIAMVRRDDIVVTQDYGLAAICLAKKARPLDADGMLYKEGNIDDLLFKRDLSRKIRMSGGRVKGPSKRTKNQNMDFAAALKKLIEEIQNSSRDKSLN